MPLQSFLIAESGAHNVHSSINKLVNSFEFLQGTAAAVLKGRGLIESLTADASTDQRYGSEIEVSVSLTPLGLEKVCRFFRIKHRFIV